MSKINNSHMYTQVPISVGNMNKKRELLDSFNKNYKKNQAHRFSS